MSTAEALLRDLSLLLELTLVPADQNNLEEFSEQLIDRLLARTFAYNALFFVRSELTHGDHTLDDTPRETLLTRLHPPAPPEGYVALPRKRAQYLVGSLTLDTQNSGIEGIIRSGETKVVAGDESVLARVAFSGLERPAAVLQMAVGDVGVLEIYGGASGLMDDHLARVLSTLSGWLASQARCFAERALSRRRLTDLATSERWVARLFDELPGVVWGVDIHGRVTYLSRAAEPLLGLGQASTWAELRRGIHPDDQTRVEQAIAAAIAERRPILDLRYRFRRNARDVVAAHERILLDFLPGGGLIHKAGFIEASPSSADEPASETALSRPHFMDRLSHELRAPLFPVIALSDLLRQSEPGDVSSQDWTRHLGMINRSGKALLELVTDLLELSRIEVRRTRLDAGPIDMPHLVGDLRSRFSSEDAPLEVRYEPNNRANTIYTDRSALDRIAQALIVSTRSLSGRNGAELSFGAEPESVVIRALARDVSLPSEVVTSWFEPFCNVPREPREHSVGDGLSMTLVQELCLTLGGQCGARSTPDGHLIEVKLPARIPVAQSPPPLSGEVAVIAASKLHDLLWMTLEFQSLGGEVRAASDAVTAEQHLRAGRVDVLITCVDLLRRGSLLEAAHSSATGPPTRCFVIDELLPTAPEGFEAIIRPSGGRAALLEALLSSPGAP